QPRLATPATIECLQLITVLHQPAAPRSGLHHHAVGALAVGKQVAVDVDVHVAGMAGAAVHGGVDRTTVRHHGAATAADALRQDAVGIVAVGGQVTVLPHRHRLAVGSG